MFNMKLSLVPIWAAALLTLNTSAQPALKDAFKSKFLIGTALNDSQVTEKNAAQAALVKQQFNSITPVNVMKWGPIHPEAAKFNFEPADRFVEFGERNGTFTIGHTLVWHSQTPNWVFQNDMGGPADRAALLARMSNHIHTVVGRYKGRVKGWDVVNEALNDDGSLRQSPWLKIIGEDYLAKAFQFAQAADPKAELYYNDYSLESPAKRNGAVVLVKKLQAAGVKITGIGNQSHLSLTSPPINQVEETITAFARLGVKVMITELDVSVLPFVRGVTGADVGQKVAPDPKLNPYTNGLPASVQQALAKRYGELFGVYVKHADKISRVTFWGVTDSESWLNNFPIRGRTNYPLLFDREGKPKPAFDAVIRQGKSAAP